MENHPKSKKAPSLTPSTLKLHQLLADRDPKMSKMLTEEELDLLRKSKREISEVCRNFYASENNQTASSPYGVLADMTDKVASLKEIEEAISSGRAEQDGSENK